MGLNADFDSFENIFAAVAVIENYPSIDKTLENGDSPAKYWKRALSQMESLIHYNPERFILALNLLPEDRKAVFNANVQNICAAMDADRLFEAGSQPGFHTKRAGRITGKLAVA
jgi:hypothetical protein